MQCFLFAVTARNGVGWQFRPDWSGDEPELDDILDSADLDFGSDSEFSSDSSGKQYSLSYWNLCWKKRYDLFFSSPTWMAELTLLNSKSTFAAGGSERGEYRWCRKDTKGLEINIETWEVLEADCLKCRSTLKTKQENLMDAVAVTRAFRKAHDKSVSRITTKLLDIFSPKSIKNKIIFLEC